MDYSIPLLIISTNLVTFFASVWYCNQKFIFINQSLNNIKIVDEILHSKIINLKEDLERIEKFNLKLLEKNIIFKENRAWDYIDTDEDEDEDEDY